MPQPHSAKSLLQTLRQTPYILGYLFFRVVRRQRDMVLFLSTSSDRLVGNMAAVHDELTERGVHIEAVLKRSLRHHLPLRERIRLCRLMATAKVIVLDDFYPMIYQIPISSKTQLLQLWHASGAFKTMGFSRSGKPGGPIAGSRTHRNYTAAIVSAPSVRANFAEAFGIDLSRVHATGVPRTDPFFDAATVTRTSLRVRDQLDIPDNKKFLVFAPTFRGNGQLTAHYAHEWIDWEDLGARLGPDWIIGYKPHPFVTTRPAIQGDPRFRDLSDFADTNSLLMAADLLITDYSSIIFDYALLGRPTIFFCPDLEEYIASRDFYYPYERYTFGPVARNYAELISAIEMDRWDRDAQAEFLDFFCGACDGHSTSRVTDQLIMPFLSAGAGR